MRKILFTILLLLGSWGINSFAQDKDSAPKRWNVGIVPFEYVIMGDWDYTFALKSGIWAGYNFGKSNRWMVNTKASINTLSYYGLFYPSSVNKTFVGLTPGLYYRLNKSERVRNNIGLNLHYEIANPSDSMKKKIIGILPSYILDVKINKNFFFRLNPAFGMNIYQSYNFNSGVIEKGRVVVASIYGIAVGCGLRF